MPDAAHELTLGYTTGDDGLHLTCCCGWSHALGFDSTPDDVRLAVAAHWAEVQPMPAADKSSPLPWTAVGTGVYGADGFLLADFAPPPIHRGHRGTAGHWATTPGACRERSEAEEDANVALTLRAVNRGPAFAALVAALKDVTASLAMFRVAERFVFGDYRRNETLEALDAKVLAALKLAEAP